MVLLGECFVLWCVVCCVLCVACWLLFDGCRSLFVGLRVSCVVRCLWLFFVDGVVLVCIACCMPFIAYGCVLLDVCRGALLVV